MTEINSPIRPGQSTFWIQNKVKSVDVDSDGKLDLVFFNTNAANGAAVTIYKGDGAGGFTFQPIPDPGLVQGLATAIGDFNGDSHPDILIVQPGESQDRIVVLPNDGAGRFGKQQVESHDAYSGGRMPQFFMTHRNLCGKNTKIQLGAPFSIVELLFVVIEQCPCL